MARLPKERRSAREIAAEKKAAESGRDADYQRLVNEQCRANRRGR